MARSLASTEPITARTDSSCRIVPVLWLPVTPEQPIIFLLCHLRPRSSQMTHSRPSPFWFSRTPVQDNMANKTAECYPLRESLCHIGRKIKIFIVNIDTTSISEIKVDSWSYTWLSISNSGEAHSLGGRDEVLLAAPSRMEACRHPNCWCGVGRKTVHAPEGSAFFRLQTNEKEAIN